MVRWRRDIPKGWRRSRGGHCLDGDRSDLPLDGVYISVNAVWQRAQGRRINPAIGGAFCCNIGCLAVAAGVFPHEAQKRALVMQNVTARPNWNLRACASSREANLLFFSREDAKAGRNGMVL